ncbi:MAG: hypothetical protein KDK70_28630 [Myxococcales bacterium]|nr:hypothetical protein [Myxococcales bacterium]
MGLGLSLGLGLAVGLSLVGGCIEVEPFRCQLDRDCVLDGQPGQCRMFERVCIYPDAHCPSQWSTAAGTCMDPVADDTSTGPPLDDGTAETSAGTTDAPVDCDPTDAQDITALGTVWASSVFRDQYPASLAVDGDYGTSWMSAGLDLEGNPSLFEWTAAEPRCITRIAVIGNAMNDDPMLREQHGFESMILRIYDQDDGVVFQRMLDLSGSPDPDAIVQPEVTGVRVELELFDHEVFYTGGFGELEVAGR